MYDAQLLDDELRVMYAEFDEGVRVLVVSDSCHSGTLLKSESPGHKGSGFEDDYIYARNMPRTASKETSKKHRSMYGRIQDALPHPKPEIKASLRLLSGCQENQKSYGSKTSGRFTTAIKSLFDDGEFSGDYSEFHQKTVAMLKRPKKNQTPGHATDGVTDRNYDRQSPFKL